MKKYDSDGVCIKCGGAKIEDEYISKIPEAFVQSHNEELRQKIKREGMEIHPPRESHPLSIEPFLIARPECISRTCKNCGWVWQEAPLERELDKFVNAFTESVEISNLPTADADEAMAALKKTLKMPTDEPEIRVGDVMTVGEGDKCDHTVLAQPTKDWWCVSGYDKLFNKTNLLEFFTLINRGPEVHTFEGVEFVQCSDHVVALLNRDGKKMSVNLLKPIADNGIFYTMKLTKEDNS